MIVTEKAPAKLNLSLDTPMRYFDGSPKWDMVMVSADLADYVTVETHRRPATIKVYTNSGFLPNDQRNLAYQAAHILRNRFHCKDGVTIRIFFFLIFCLRSFPSVMTLTEMSRILLFLPVFCLSSVILSFLGICHFFLAVKTALIQPVILFVQLCVIRLNM